MADNVPDDLELKRMLRVLDIRTRSIENKLDNLIELVNGLIINLSDSGDDYENEEWSPYEIDSEFDEDSEDTDSELD